MERFFQALGDNTRLRLLNLMGDQEICVCYFVEILGSPNRRFPVTWLTSAAPASSRRGVRASGCTIGSSCRRILERRRSCGRLSVAERRKDHAGRPGAADQGVLLSGEVRDLAGSAPANHVESMAHLRFEVNNVQRSLHPRPGLCTCGSKEALVSRPLSDSLDLPCDGNWSWASATSFLDLPASSTVSNLGQRTSLSPSASSS